MKTLRSLKEFKSYVETKKNVFYLVREKYLFRMENLLNFFLKIQDNSREKLVCRMQDHLLHFLCIVGKLIIINLYVIACVYACYACVCV